MAASVYSPWNKLIKRLMQSFVIPGPRPGFSGMPFSERFLLMLKTHFGMGVLL